MKRLLLISMITVLASAVWSQEYSLNQFLNIQRATNPSFSPGGKELVYLTNISGVNQVWRVKLLTEQTSQLTFEPDGVEGAWWSPTNPELMVIAASQGGSEMSQLFLFNPTGSPWYRITKDDQAMYTFGAWSRAGTAFAYVSNERNKTDFDIYYHSISQQAPVMLIEAEGYNQVVGFSPDDRYLLYVRHHSNVNSDIFLYDFETQETRLLTEHEGDAVFSSPQWDGTSEGFYLLCDQDRDFLGVAHYSIVDQKIEWIETPDWDVELLAVSPNGNSLVWIINDSGYSKFNFKNLETNSVVGAYRFPNGVFRSIEYSANGERIAMSFGSSTRPFDIWFYETESELLRQVTHSATGGVAYAVFKDPELIEYESFDGRKIPALWYLPETDQKSVPVIVWVHGGPESQARPDMSGLIQYFLYNGYAILEPNIRGSSGYGREYLALDNVEKRMDSVTDIEYAAKWLKKQKIVNDKKLAIMGGSYGGFMVLSNLATYPDLWAAVVSIVGISNFVTFLENTGPYRRALREAEYGSLEQDSEFLTSISPLTHVDKISAPLMLIQGANDPRVPQSEADQIAEAIHANGGEVEYLLFEDEGHGISKTANRIKAYSSVVEFLDKHLENK
ncbi:S9 family peptidase [bacterium]|nr:S9 family peptidase [bacterium]